MNMRNPNPRYQQQGVRLQQRPPTSFLPMGDFGAEEQAGSQGAAEQQAMFGLPPQDFINALYDIFGSYPRTNCIPYANGFTLSGVGGASPQLLANGVGRPSVKTSADAAHIITHITGTSAGAYSLFMRSDSSDRQYMTIPVHNDAMVGTAERPFPLPKPMLLAPNTTLSFDLQDLSGQPNDIWFTLWGFKVYRRQYAAAG